MKNTQLKSPSGFHMLFVISATLIFILINGCKWINSKLNDAPVAIKNKPLNYDTNQVIVWRDPDAEVDFRHLIDSIAAEKNLTVTYCSNCDSDLALLTGDTALRALKLVAQSPTGGSTGGGGTKSGGFYWLVNYAMNTTDPFYRNDTVHSKPVQPKVLAGAPVVVGVLDSGVDTAYLNSHFSKYFNAAGSLSCMGSDAGEGWNIADNNRNYKDEYHLPDGHGLVVADLVSEQVQMERARVPRNEETGPAMVLPVRIVNRADSLTLYSVLCGIAYAKKMGAKVINASFGYYSCGPDSAAILFGKYIHHYLTNEDPSKNIYLVCAAGNSDFEEKRDRCGNGFVMNLDNINFYPASFAAEDTMPNVIAVTTVSIAGGQVSPKQNFSKHVVNIGVDAQAVSAGNYLFSNPAVDPQSTGNNVVEGSSFATPVISGIIAAHYNNLSDRAKTDKKYLLKELYSKDIISMNPLFDLTIKGCYVVKR